MSKSSIYDFVVVGAGLTGLTVATSLSKKNYKVLLLEESDQVGGLNHAVTSPLGPINKGLRFVPGTDAAGTAIQFLTQVIEKDLGARIHEIPPKTYSSGEFQPFMGFGENSPEFVDDLGYFLNPYRYEVMSRPEEWTQDLTSKFKGDLILRSQVTQFQVEDNRVRAAIVNGQKTVYGNHFVFCANPKNLLPLLPAEYLAGKSRQKLSKSELATAVCLDLFHSKTIAQDLSMMILGGQSEEAVFCVGCFSAANETTGEQSSQWVTFVHDQNAEDSENVGVSLRKMKREIKKAFPDAFDTLAFERVFVASSVGGKVDLKLGDNQNLQGLENLHLVSPNLNESFNLVGGLLAAKGFVENYPDKVETVAPSAEKEDTAPAPDISL